MKKLFATLILIFALISCDDPLFLDGDRNERDKEKDNGETTSLEFKEIFNSKYHYHNELTERMTFVAKSKEEESKIYKYITWMLAVPQQFPEIDYNNKMLLCIVMPPQSSGSYKLKVSDVKLQNGKILVSSELLIPEIGTDDIGYPVVFIEIDKRSEPVEFLETKMVNEHGSDIIEGDWELFEAQKVDSDGNIIESIIEFDGGKAYFTISDFKLDGYSPCNLMQGTITYITESGKIKMNAGPITEVYCGEFESHLSYLFLYCDQYEVKNEQLILKSSNNELKYNKMIFKKI